MIDVGRHFGEFLDLFHRDGWRIIAFEPSAETGSKLTIIYEKFENIAIDSRAASEQAQESMPFYSSSVSIDISRLSAFHSSHVKSDEVKTTTLRVALAERGVSKVDFLKIDTEGFDLPVLKGFPWDTASPAAVVVEFEDAKTVPLGYRYSGMGQFLVDQGYRIILSEWFPVAQYGTKHQWRRAVEFPAALLDERGWGNFVAIRDDSLFEALMARLKN